MPSRGAEIFGASNNCFPPNFSLKKGNFNLSETESLGFAMKRVIYSFVWSYFRVTSKSIMTRAFQWLCQQICVTLFCIHKWACKKTFFCEVMIFPIEYILALCRYWAFNNRFHIFGQSQMIPIVMENNCIYGAHMQNMVIWGRKACKRHRKSQKACLLN